MDLSKNSIVSFNLFSAMIDLISIPQLLFTVRVVFDHESGYERFTSSVLFISTIPICLLILSRAAHWFYGFRHYGETMDENEWKVKIRVAMLEESFVPFGVLSPYLLCRFYLARSSAPFSKDMYDAGQILAATGFVVLLSILYDFFRRCCCTENIIVHIPVAHVELRSYQQV